MDTTYVPAIQRVESHPCYVETFRARYNDAVRTKAPEAEISLLDFIICRLVARNGTGFAPEIRLDEFQSLQRRRGIGPSECLAAWQRIDWSPHRRTAPALCG